MKHILSRIFIALLFFRAQGVLRSAKKIIGITGTVGKTSTRMAIFHVLRFHFSVQTSEKNFNTPIGILLSLLNIHESGTSFTKWMHILFRAFCTPLPKPDILILEYGVDAPHDMDRLLDICIPHITIITPISLGHLEKGKFSSQEEILHEKLKLAKATKEMVYINGFDKNMLEKIQHECASSLSHSPYSIIDANTVLDIHSTEKGVKFTLDGTEYEAPMLGSFQAQIFAPAVLLGKKEGISSQDIQTALSSFSAPSGRGKMFLGKQGEVLWDFSYNASPKAVLSTLDALSEAQGYTRKIIILGNMNELGSFSEQEHERVGKRASECGDEIYFIGKNEKNFSAFQKGVGGGKPLSYFFTAKEASQALQRKFQKGDILLIKGSQGDVYLEALVESLLKNPNDTEGLCRRGAEWDRKRKICFSEKKF